MSHYSSIWFIINNVIIMKMPCEWKRTGWCLFYLIMWAEFKATNLCPHRAPQISVCTRNLTAKFIVFLSCRCRAAATERCGDAGGGGRLIKVDWRGLQEPFLHLEPPWSSRDRSPVRASIHTHTHTQDLTRSRRGIAPPLIKKLDLIISSDSQFANNGF